MSTLYTPEFLSSLSDEDLKGHYEWTLGDCGEQDSAVQSLAAECERRGLIKAIPIGPPADGSHFATSIDDYAAFLDAMDGQGEQWVEAIYADAAAQGFARTDIEAAYSERIAPLVVANDPV
jgi:hypothetical protein